MDILVLSRSPSFERYIRTEIEGSNRFRFLHSADNIAPWIKSDTPTFLLHAASFREATPAIVTGLAKHSRAMIAVAADIPDLDEMLSLSRYGIRAYFNSYMANVHYQHMFRLLEGGLSWFAPDLLVRTLELARRNMTDTDAARESSLEILTPREKEVALAVAQGMNNKQIAKTLGITERTVKTHLTHIFEKLDIKDRVALAIRLNLPPGQFTKEG